MAKRRRSSKRRPRVAAAAKACKGQTKGKFRACMKNYFRK